MKLLPQKPTFHLVLIKTKHKTVIGFFMILKIQHVFVKYNLFILKPSAYLSRKKRQWNEMNIRMHPCMRASLNLTVL